MHWVAFCVLWWAGLAIGNAIFATGQVSPTWLMCFSAVWAVFCILARDLIKVLRAPQQKE